MKRFVWILMTLLVLGGAGVGVFYLQAADSDSSATADAGDTGDDTEAEDEKEDTAIPVDVVDVRRGSISTYLTATTNLVPEDEVVVLGEAEGRVTQLHVEEGDLVQKGDLLAALFEDEARILYDKAHVKKVNAELAYERAQRVFQEDLIAQEEFDRTKLDFEVAKQELAEAEWQLTRRKIRAPFDGRVTRRDITLGQHVRPGDELFRVTSFDPLVARIFLPERDVLALDPGRRVDITLKADETVTFDGRIQRISPVVDPATGTVKVTVEAVRPPRVVRPGGFVIIDIVRDTHDDTMVLPRNAVVRELSQAHVFVVREDKAEKREVELGLEEDETLEIVAGLEAGERVVVAGQGGLRDGTRVEILADGEATASTESEAGSETDRG